MVGDEFDDGGVGFAVVGASVAVDGKGIVGVFDDFLDFFARFDGDADNHGIIIL